MRRVSFLVAAGADGVEDADVESVTVAKRAVADANVDLSMMLLLALTMVLALFVIEKPLVVPRMEMSAIVIDNLMASFLFLCLI